MTDNPTRYRHGDGVGHGPSIVGHLYNPRTGEIELVTVEPEWRPFEPCLENVNEAMLTSYLPYVGYAPLSIEGRVFNTPDFDATGCPSMPTLYAKRLSYASSATTSRRSRSATGRCGSTRTRKQTR